VKFLKFEAWLFSMEKSHPGEFEQGLAIWEGGNKEARIREDCGKSFKLMKS
jgi:hypothetical protein